MTTENCISLMFIGSALTFSLCSYFCTFQQKGCSDFYKKYYKYKKWFTFSYIMLYQKFIKPIDAKSLSSNDKNIENANDFHFSVWEVNDVYAKLTL